MTDEDILNASLQKMNKAEKPVCYFPNAVEKIENPTVTARRLRIRYSAIKLGAVANAIHGLHVYDAENMLNHIDKKGGEFVKNALTNARRAGQRAGYAEDRMFVKSIIVGRGISHKKIDIKARGKYGTIKVPKSNLRLVLEEKNEADFYKMALKGESPPGMGDLFRRILY